MNNSTLLVHEFHQKYGHPVALKPGLPAKELQDFRVALIEEELQELREALAAGDLVQVADALGDLLYVVEGTALTFGLPLAKIVEEIHRSNMTKDCAGPGKPTKGADYEPPRLRKVIKELG